MTPTRRNDSSNAQGQKPGCGSRRQQQRFSCGGRWKHAPHGGPPRSTSAHRSGRRKPRSSAAISFSSLSSRMRKWQVRPARRRGCEGSRARLSTKPIATSSDRSRRSAGDFSMPTGFTCLPVNAVNTSCLRPTRSLRVPERLLGSICSAETIRRLTRLSSGVTSHHRPTVLLSNGGEVIGVTSSAPDG